MSDVLFDRYTEESDSGKVKRLERELEIEEKKFNELLGANNEFAARIARLQGVIRDQAQKNDRLIKEGSDKTSELNDIIVSLFVRLGGADAIE